MKHYIFIFSAALFLAACGEQKTPAQKLKDEISTKKGEMSKLQGEIANLEAELLKLDSNAAKKGKPVQLLTITPTTFVHSIDIQGRVDAEESVTVGPQMPGMVKRVLVQPGDRVSAGQLLAELDADAMVQQLGALKIQRDLTKQIFDRQRNLWEQKIGTEVQFLQAKAGFEAIEKQVLSLEEQIDMARIKAPMAGVVDNVGLKVGEMASPGFTTIMIVNGSKLRVKGEVAEGYVAKVKTGNPVIIELPDAGKTIDANVTYAGRIINKLNRTFNVEVAIRPDENVVPNMVAIMKIEDYRKDNQIVVPLGCIQQGADGKSFVYIAKTNGKKVVAERREITYSMTYNGKAQIDTGLAAGDKVVTEGYAELNTGDEISGN
ncbi:MAG: efflux RND transporter periplasmic adaptor subunit [Bacteroidia bacterium]|jgi:RND family efflux transporter MFP subunit|nr:efflux RND transporter periplasmic adaptor subunit [Bacteroidia bacterium]